VVNGMSNGHARHVIAPSVRQKKPGRAGVQR